VRPDNRVNGPKDFEILSGEASSYQILRQGKPKESYFPDQQFRAPTAYHSQTLQVPLAGGTIFQVDQTTSQNQEILWHIRKCSENSDMDRYIGICARGHYQKETPLGSNSIHNSTDFELNPI
jgi:hypothetical protein